MTESETPSAHRPHRRSHHGHRSRHRNPYSGVNRQAAMVLLWLRRALAVPLLGLAIWGLAVFPVASLPLLGGLTAYVALLWWRPSAWLLVLPVLLAGLDLTPYSGRLLWNEFDYFVLATIAMGLWHKEPWRFGSDIGSGGKRLLGLLLVTQALFTLHGLWPIPAFEADTLANYMSPWNSLRMAKGFFGALLLLPMLQQVRARGDSIGRLLATGLLAALAVALVTILWERLGFTGLFNFYTRYRITGLFSGMHNGGASLDAFLAMSAAFIPALFLFWHGHLHKLLGLLLASVSLYALAVTFTRSDYLAAGALGLAVLYGLWRYRRITHHIQRKPLSGPAWFVLGVVSVTVLGALAFSLRGGFLSERFSTTREDLQTRLHQWSGSAAMMPKDVYTSLFGMGKGSYPRTRMWHDLDNGKIPGTYQYEYDPDGNAFLRIGRSPDRNSGLSIRQRLHADGGNWRLQLRLRTPDGDKTRLLVEFCERNILLPNTECRWVGINTEAGRTDWETYNTQVDLTGLGKTHWWGSKPVEISILNRGLNAALDIDDIQLIGADGRHLLANPGFEDGMDHWLHAFEDHLAWHIKNILYDAWFEGGALGLATLFLLYGYLFARLRGRILAGDSAAMLIAAALAAVFVVGMFDSLFDDPRIGLLFYLLVWTAMLPAEPALDARKVMAWDGRATRLERAFAVYQGQPGFIRYGAVALLLVLMVSAATLYVMRSQQLDRTQMVLRIARLVGLEPKGLIADLLPDPKYPDYQFDGHVKPLHPRILMPELVTWDGRSIPDVILRRRELWKEQKIPAYNPCTSSDLIGNISCWMGEGIERRGKFLLGNALKLKIIPPSAGGNQYGNAWMLAIASDFLDREPTYNAADRATIQQRLIDALNDYLILLDGNSISAWHGRLTMASNAWLVAMALDANVHWKQDLVRRAQAHFVEEVRAVAFSEAWPEGFNYWINSRGYTFALAVAAYVNGLDDAANTPWIRNALERIGLWMVYATRPDNRAAEVADEGPRVDLKDETRRVVDIIAGVTRDPVFATYSRYLAKIHRAESYYRDYRAAFQLLNDPTVEPFPDIEWGSLVGLKWHLPTADLFGPGATDLAYIRSGWGPDDTFISFRAGASMTHHGHYDAGHFTLFKGAPLALTSGTYGDFFSRHRLDYSIRTVATNSLLILRPNETVQPNTRFEPNVADGGQRLVIPTGSAIASVTDFKANLGQGMHYEGGRITAFNHARDDHTYIAADLTDAYNSTRFDTMDAGGKVSEVRRELLYLDTEDRLLIHDHVVSTHPEYVKKWLLHTADKPEVEGARVLVGKADDGILETRADHAVVNNGRGHMDVQRLYPSDAVMRLVGGPDYRFYVETDADESKLDGRNISEGVRDAKWFDTGAWRIEIQPGAARLADDFLVALSPRLDATPRSSLLALDTGDTGAQAIATDKAVVVFINARSKPPLHLASPAGRDQLYLLGLPDGIRVEVNGVPAQPAVTTGVLHTPLPDTAEIVVNWRESKSPDRM